MIDIPRRCQMEHWTPAERAIYDALRAVEAIPTNVLNNGVLVTLVLHTFNIYVALVEEAVK